MRTRTGFTRTTRMTRTGFTRTTRMTTGEGMNGWWGTAGGVEAQQSKVTCLDHWQTGRPEAPSEYPLGMSMAVTKMWA